MKPTLKMGSLGAFFNAGIAVIKGKHSQDPSTHAPSSDAPYLNSENSGCGGSCDCGTNPAIPTIFEKPLNRRQAIGQLFKGVAIGGVALASQVSAKASDDKERDETVQRLQRISQIDHGVNSRIATTKPKEKVLFGYAFNISKCQGYMDCVKACVEENNQDRKTGIQYITIHEMNTGEMNLMSSNKKFYHEVPAEGHFYMGTQCFHCENPPCTKVCPVGATWKEVDGIVVVDYDWCIGCRYCEAACPYFGRRFNWGEPEVPKNEINPAQHYLGNRLRTKGVMEKCTFCVQRSRDGKQPACVEACPTGARIFGNLLDPKSDIRWVLANKKVFRLKEDLGTEPKFWYFMD
jgi:Fe-S-cluster-containing dehydrogenase component